MRNPTQRRALRGVLPRTALAAALGIGLSVLTLDVAAQSNATGTIFGIASAPGDSIVLRSLDSGTTRTITSDAAGRFRAASLPVGRYSVSVQRDGAVVATREDVTVRLGSGVDVSFGTGDATDLDRVQVTGVAGPAIDVSQVDTRHVFTAEDIERTTVARNIQALALLTPSVVAGDSRYGGTASFGGSSASENAYYINGYAVTHPYTAIGSSTLPFGGIAQYQAITGGYGAEFGRATGGVVNIVTQRGTNDWKFGAQAVWSPDSGSAKRRNIYFPEGTSSPNAGRVYHDRQTLYEDDALTYAAYVGGPIVKNKLFFYVSGEVTERNTDTLAASAATTSQTGYRQYDYEIPRWLAKLDWNITDDHLFELTAVSDVTRQTDTYYGYDYASGTVNYNQVSGYDYEDGGELYIGKYTGYLTDNLTLTALYGSQKLDHSSIQFGLNPDPDAVYVSDGRQNIPAAQRVTGVQPFASTPWADAYDKTEGYRFDLEWRVGEHDIRVGLDHQDLEVRRGTNPTGPGYTWAYSSGTPGAPIGGGAVIPASGEYVTRGVTRLGGTFSVEQSAQYIEDRWQVSDNWLLSLGLRNEQFTNYNTERQAFISQRNQLAPRLGVAWDVHGDSSLKLFANAGRYHLALPNRTAYRQALPSTNYSEYFAFTGIDPVTGVPLGITPLGNGPHSPNNEFGQAKDPTSIAARDIKSHYQDEFIVGFEQRINDQLNIGTRFVYRDLKHAIEDFCDFRPGVAWAEANGIDPWVPGGIVDSFYNCRLFNPGEDNTFLITDDNGTVTEVPLTAAQLGFPKLKRRYLGVNLFADFRLGERIQGRVDYTWSHNYGNAEGQLLSDLGQGDVSATQTFDFPELGLYSNGNLPNDRRHYLKTYGSWDITPQWRVSATFTAASGRPLNRLGRLPDDVSADDPYFYDYIYYNGPYYFFVDGEPSPRGSAGTLPWTYKLDLGLSWKPAFAGGKLQVRGDAFNVFDSQTTQNVTEYWEWPGAGQVYAYAHQPLSFQSPRSLRLQVRYDY